MYSIHVLIATKPASRDEVPQDTSIVGEIHVCQLESISRDENI